MQKTLFILFSCLCCCGIVYSQSAKKGFKLLEKLEYDKARSTLEELRSSDPQNPAAHFGLALIYSDDKSPFFNLVKAWQHCRTLQENMEKLPQDDLEIIGEYFINTEARSIPRPVKKKIEYAVKIIEAHLIKYVREENNLALAYEVLEKFPDFRYYKNVVHIRNQLEFRKVEKQPAVEAYAEFIEKFPDAAQIDKAVRYRNQLAFEKAARINTVEAYDGFIREYPDADEYNMAVRNRNAAAFAMAKTVNTLQAYEDYIERYSGSLEVAEAKLLQKQLLYDYARKIKTVEAYNEFIRKYPEGQQYLDIFNLKSLDIGMKYLSTSSITSSNVQWTRSFDLGEQTETSGALESLADNRLMLTTTTRRNDTSLTDIWLLCLDSDGKMIWNKTLGDAFDDQALFSSVNLKNEVVIVANSWTGFDPSAYEVWLFKQGAEGRNVWSQKLSRWCVNTLLTDNNNNILLGGYEPGDSLKKNYRIMVLNDAGRRLWNRVYTGTGEVMWLGVMPDEAILVVADNWICKMDDGGYIRWEYLPAAPCAYQHAVILEKGECLLGGIHEHGITLTKLNADGKKSWDKQHALPGSVSSIRKMLPAGAGRTLIATNDRQGGNDLLWIMNQTGEIMKRTRLENGKINDILTDGFNNLLILIEDENAILIKNAGVDF